MNGVGIAIVVLWVFAGIGAGAAEAPDAEPAAPAATMPVQLLLEESRKYLEQEKPEEALAAADRALAAADEARDRAGLGYAHGERARSLAAGDRSDEALAAWKEAQGVWESTGATPEQIEALGARAVLYARAGNDEEVDSLVELAVSLANQEQGRPLTVARTLNSLSTQINQAGRLVEATRLAQAALEIASDRAPGSPDVALSLSNLGILAWTQGDLVVAREYHQRALEIREKRASGSADVAASLNNLGTVAWRQGDLERARSYFRRALEIWEVHAPGSLDVAGVLNNLGAVAWNQGDLEVANDLFRRALAITEKHAPGSLDIATSLNNLAAMAWARGDLDATGSYLRRALAITEKLAPGSLGVARGLSNLGGLAWKQGDLEAAREYHWRALAIEEKHAPGSLSVASTLHNVGSVAWRQSDLDAAGDYFRRALAIKEAHAPGSLDVATSLTGLGLVAEGQGDLDAAMDYHRRALAIKEKHAPGSPDVATNLVNLGSVTWRQGESDAARDYFRRALAIREQHAPGSLGVAKCLHNLAGLAEEEGDLEVAKDHYARALEIRERHAPGSIEAATSLNNLGNVVKKQGDLKTAEELLSRSWQIIREQRHVVVGDEAGRAFAEEHDHFATDLIAVRLARGNVVAALEVLEESRAQGLLELLSERGLAHAGVDAGLWQRFEAAEREFDAAVSHLGETSARQALLEREVTGLASDDSAESGLAAKQQGLTEATNRREEALTAYTRARLKKERLLGEVRRRVPGLEPRKFSFDEARRALPGDAVFVTFSLGKDNAHVFAIPSDPERPVIARTLPVGEAELSARVAALRAKIGAGDALRGIGGLAVAGSGQKAADHELVAASRALFDDLFPDEARAAMDGAERIIVSPSGPLWELPFAALVMNSSGEPEWLGLERRLSYTPSLTVLAGVGEAEPRPAEPGRHALVVGDPLFVRASVPAAIGATEPAILRGERFYLASNGAVPARLPATAVEARRVAALYDVQPLLGEAATEAAVREKLTHASVVHLATHGYFNPQLAMSSGILLAPPAGEVAIDATDDDGALQAWEFGTSLPLQANLVVLSACETGLGETARGEGLVGLTRALQAAGAQSVVATHWKVADEATADLMVTFHKHLWKGAAKDEALRQAMRKNAERKRTRHPFYWAPFFLTGDPDRPVYLSE